MSRLFLILATAFSFLLTGPGSAAEPRTLKMATIAPSLSQAITMATFANIVTQNLDNIKIEVASGGAGTLHQLEMGRGNLDLAMTSPVTYNLMAEGRVMYANQADAPDAAQNVRLIMWFPYGQHHFTVRADSDIQTLDDLEGASVFLGPQGGGAYNTARGWIKATTNLEVGTDYEAIKASWQTGFQAFLDGKIDVYDSGCLDPCGQFLQLSETEKFRFLGPRDASGAAVDKYLGAFRYRENIPAGAYKGQMNTDAVTSVNVSVGVAVRADLDDETVYQITKAFWDNLEQVTSEAPWAKALNIPYAVAKRGKIELHPGAQRYYKEIGAL